MHPSKIKLWPNRLTTSDPTPELIQSGLSKIPTSTARTQALIEGLLNYTQLDDIKSKTEIVDLSAMFQLGRRCHSGERRMYKVVQKNIFVASFDKHYLNFRARHQDILKGDSLLNA